MGSLKLTIFFAPLHVREAAQFVAQQARGRLASSVSKSVGVLDLSGKKPAKPPRRQSVSSKPTASPAPRTFAEIQVRSRGAWCVPTDAFSVLSRHYVVWPQ
ncbi:uncharacterized protein Fot_15522 [Forsythia ovata]|uniref:Uncharacterized protein n=1 Tax=Forsythia ovata TaxID=205694 RepID=A0ABD1W9H0_9LAMI